MHYFSKLMLMLGIIWHYLDYFTTVESLEMNDVLLLLRYLL